MSLGQPAVGAGATVLAVLLGEAAGSPGDRAALYVRARSLALPVCEAGPLDALGDIVQHARRDASASDADESLRDEARAFLESLERNDIAEALLVSLERLGAVTSEGEGLIDAIGAPALWSIARRLRSRPGAPLANDLRRALLARGVAWWIRGLAHAELRPLVELAPLFPLIRGLEPEKAWPIASTLLRHPDQQARHQVAAFLLGLGCPEASWRRLVATFLHDEDRVLADMARSAILRFPDQAGDLVRAALDRRVTCPAEGRVLTDLEALLAALPAAAPRAGGDANPASPSHPASSAPSATAARSEDES